MELEELRLDAKTKITEEIRYRVKKNEKESIRTCWIVSRAMELQLPKGLDRWRAL
ncbi:MAG: hypothetical protein QXJ58_06030 [Archaeoglobaceae archaeon]